MTALDSPPIAARLRDVASSPVREILALTARPGVISFAGGLPAPELFDAAGPARGVRGRAVGRARRPLAAVLDHRGRPGAARRDRRPADRARAADRGRRAARHERLAAGAHARRRRCCSSPATACSSRSRRTWRRCRRSRWPAPCVVPVACDDDGLDPDAVAAAAAEHGARAALHDPDLPQPDRPHAAARAPARARRGRRAARAVAARGRPVRRAALPRRAAAEPGHDRPRTARSRSRRSRRSPRPGLRIGWVRTPPALRRALVVAKQAADLHSSTVDQAAAARWLAAVDLDAHIGVLRAEYGAPPRRAARRARRRAAAGLDPQPPRRRHVRVGAAARTAGTPSRLLRARAGARRRLRPRLSVLRRRAGPRRRCGSPSRPTRRPRSPRVWRGWGLPGNSLAAP